MIVQDITEENIKEYIDPVPKDFLLEIKREHLSGIACEEETRGDFCAGVFWELKNADEDSVPTEAELLWFFAKDREAGEEVLRALEERLSGEAERIFFELPSLTEAESSAFSAANYKVEKGESRDIFVTVGELSELKLSNKPIPAYILPLSEINSRSFKAGIMTSVFHGKYGILEDLPFLPMTRFDPDLSSCVMTDEKVNGFLLVHETQEEFFRVELLYAMQPDANIHLLHMMRLSIQTAASMLLPEKRVALRRHNEATRQLITKLFPGKKGETVSKGEKELKHG